MIGLIAVALQSAGPAAPTPVSPECSPSGTDEIVVCAKGPEAERYRIPEALRDAERDEPGMPRASVELGDGTAAGIRGEQADIGGFASHRLFVTISRKF